MSNDQNSAAGSAEDDKLAIIESSVREKYSTSSKNDIGGLKELIDQATEELISIKQEHEELQGK